MTARLLGGTLGTHGRVWLVAGTLCGVTLNAEIQPPAPPDPEQRRVLVLHAARREAPVPIAVDQTLQRILGHALQGSLDYYSEYIDTHLKKGDRRGELR